MKPRKHHFASRSWPFGLIIASLAMLATGLVFWQLNRNMQQAGLDDLSRRAMVLASREAPLAASFIKSSTPPLSEVLDRLNGRSRLLGMSIFSSDLRLLASGEVLGELAHSARPMLEASRSIDAFPSQIVRTSEGSTHQLAYPLSDQSTKLGWLVVYHDALYLEQRSTALLIQGLLWSLSIGLALFLITTGLVWTLFERPLFLLADWMRRLRFGSQPEQPPRSLPVRRLADESLHLAASFRAARREEAKSAHEIVRSDKAWSRERLRAHAIDALGGQTLVVVSNREPYLHQFKDGKPTLIRPASGLVTGLDPVLRATGGLWVAHGAGDADRATADSSGCIPVPPEDPRYTLKRVWITKEEEEGYYYGFSNEGLWPLCHLTHERPIFRASDWQQYVRANQRFADAVLEEIGSEHAVVMVQDYQLALVPGMLKAKRPDLRVGLFWHIPWPNAEAFRICPFRSEILHGMLGADLLGFHLQQHCNNFLETVDRMVEARLDWDRFSADIRGHTCLVRPFPISVQSWSERSVAKDDALAAQINNLRNQHQLQGITLGVGVDRIDYAKGIAERFRAIARLFDKHPEHIGRFSFIQLGAPSRTHIPRYRDLVTELEAFADEINWKFKRDSWKPIHFLVDHHEGPAVYAFLKMASVCIVSSLHDGMNLVAKEFIAAKAETDASSNPNLDPGVLVLSEFAGAARDLPESLIINPYDTEEFAAAIHQALTMPQDQRASRMQSMAMRVQENNIYRWAADFLTSLAQATKQSASPPTASPPVIIPGAKNVSITP